MAGIKVKGEASIIINSQETLAKLVFVPKDNGADWDVGGITKLIGEHLQAFGPLPAVPAAQTLESFLQKAAMGKAPIEIMLAEGIPAEDAAPAGVIWHKLPIPADIASFVEEALANAGKPELYRTRVEKVKRERVFKTPRKLPFLPPKEKVVEVWDTDEITEAVTVDPTVKEKRYAEKGKMLGVVTLAKPGIPGRTFDGRPVPPQVIKDDEFHLGAGLSRDQHGIMAQVSGVLRIGSQWADIVPLAKAAWEIATGSDGITLFFTLFSGDVRARPTGAEILAAAVARGAPQSILIDPDELDAAIGEAVASGKDLSIALFREQGAEAAVELSPDKSRAELHLRKGLGGARPLGMKAISLAVQDSGLQGFNEEKLKEAIRAFIDGQEVELRYTLLEGKTPTRGVDREVTLGVTPLSAEAAQVVLNRIKAYSSYRILVAEEKGFPLADVSVLAMVEKDAVVARVDQGALGEPGQDVFGNPLPGLPGNDPDLKLFRGLSQQGADIVADRAGLFMVKGPGKVFWGQVLEYRDAAVTVHVAADFMEASVDIIRELGPGKPLKSDGVFLALSEASVTRGIEPAAVEQALQIAALKGECKNHVVAWGEPPVAKGNMAVKWLVPMKLAKGEGGLQVAQGTALAELSKAGAEGRAGFDVIGKVLSAETAPAVTIGHDALIGETPLNAGTGAGKRLVALRAGGFKFDGTMLRISTVQGIKGDVGPAATGNINFPGEVRITGKVKPGYTVMGGQDVLIAGSAESALISAGGKAVIVQGVIGGGKGIVRARTSIEASFVEQATLMAVEDIWVKNSCTLCNIKTNGHLFLTGERGRLVGGLCKVRLGINAAEIGSEQGTRTEISFGQNYLVKDQIEVAEQEIEKIKLALPQIDRKLREVLPASASLNAFRTEKLKLMKMLEQLTMKVFTLQEKFEEHHESEIQIRGTLYPGVVMESHGRYYEIHHQRSRVIFYFDRDSGRIREKPLP
ncbi:hypothetical protein FACS1894130_03430 [Spirochaetia bacterium]|nr:hypothetical protein FACS1894130_03430 [Spirochaetia bacterium]